MDLRIFTEPQQGASYDDLLAVARETERLGFDAFFRSDHYLTMGGDGLPGPSDAWITLAGLARDTSTIRLGTLVTSTTFRLPGPLAISVAGVDQMSGGRVEFGLGAGWFGAEHRAYGIPFTDAPERFDRFEEALEIITGLWSDTTGSFSFSGDHFTLENSPGLPKPAQSKIPVIIGGKGKRRTPDLAARFADEFNVAFDSIDFTRTQFDRVHRACEKHDRDPSDLVHSNALVLCAGANEEEVTRRAAVIGREVDELRDNGLAGTPAEILDKIGSYAAAGSQRIYLQVLDLSDLDQLRLVAEEVLPHV